MPLEKLKQELAEIQAERARLQKRRDAWKKLRADTEKEKAGVDATISGKQTESAAIDASTTKKVADLKVDVRSLQAQLQGLDLPNLIPEKGEVEGIEAKIREKQLAISSLQATSQGQREALRNEVEKLREELDRLQKEAEKLRLIVEQEDAGVTKITEEARAKQEEITKSEHVVFDGPLFTFKPQHLPAIPVPRVRIVVDVENVLQAGDPTQVITQAQDATAKIVQSRRQAIEAQLAELDAGYGRFRANDPEERDGHLDSLELLVDSFAGKLDTIEKDALGAISEVFTVWQGAKKQSVVYKVKAGLRIAWNTVKGAFAISRAVASSGVDVTAYLQLAKAVVNIAREVKSLLGTVDEAWADVEAHRAAVAELASRGGAMQVAGTLVSQLLPLVKGSIGKLEEAAKVHQAKLGGVIQQAEALTTKLNALLDAQGKLPAAVVTADLIASTAAALEAASETTQLATRHREAHVEVTKWIGAFNTQNGAAAMVAFAARGLKTAPPRLGQMAGALDDAVTFFETVMGLL